MKIYWRNRYPWEPEFLGLSEDHIVPNTTRPCREQVEKIVRIAREHGMEPASPDEARKILGLKGLGNVKFQKIDHQNTKY